MTPAAATDSSGSVSTGSESSAGTAAPSDSSAGAVVSHSNDTAGAGSVGDTGGSARRGGSDRRSGSSPGGSDAGGSRRGELGTRVDDAGGSSAAGVIRVAAHATSALAKGSRVQAGRPLPDASMNRRVDAVLRCPCRLLLAVGIALVALFAVPSLAGASTDYWVEACGPSAVDDFSFFSSDTVNLVGSDSACGASNPAGLAVNDLATGAQEPAGTTAFWALSAPTDETIQGLFYTGGNFTTSGGGWIAGWQGDNGGGLTPALDPDAGHDCSSPNTVCNTSNAESPDFGSGCRGRAAEPSRACDRLARARPASPVATPPRSQQRRSSSSIRTTRLTSTRRSRTRTSSTAMTPLRRT